MITTDLEKRLEIKLTNYFVTNTLTLSKATEPMKTNDRVYW